MNRFSGPLDHGTNRFCGEHPGFVSLLQDGKAETLLHRHRFRNLYRFNSLSDSSIQCIFPHVRLVCCQVRASDLKPGGFSLVVKQ